MSAKTLEYNATLGEITSLSPKLAIFRLRPDVPARDARWFVPGQYLTLGLNNEVKPELGSVRRPMSIASAPHLRDEVEFYIRYVDHPSSANPFTHLLWKQNPGDRIQMRMSVGGRFTLPDTIGPEDRRKKILVAAGTGLAPFISELRDRKAQDPSGDLSDFVLCHGASYDYELGYREELEAMQQQNGLHYLPTVSRASSCPAWDGLQGRVEDLFLPERLDDSCQRMGFRSPEELHPEAAVILVCGLVGTVATTIRRLLPRGFIPEQRRFKAALDLQDQASALFYEQYDVYPPFALKDPAVVEELKAQYRPRSTAIAN